MQCWRLKASCGLCEESGVAESLAANDRPLQWVSLLNSCSRLCDWSCRSLTFKGRHLERNVYVCCSQWQVEESVVGSRNKGPVPLRGHQIGFESGAILTRDIMSVGVVSFECLRFGLTSHECSVIESGVANDTTAPIYKDCLRTVNARTHRIRSAPHY